MASFVFLFLLAVEKEGHAKPILAPERKSETNASCAVRFCLDCLSRPTSATGCTETAGIYLSIRDLRDVATCLAGGPHEKLSLNKARVWRPRRKGMRHDERCVVCVV